MLIKVKLISGSLADRDDIFDMLVGMVWTESRFGYD